MHSCANIRAAKAGGISDSEVNPGEHSVGWHSPLTRSCGAGGSLALPYDSGFSLQTTEKNEDFSRMLEVIMKSNSLKQGEKLRSRDHPIPRVYKTNDSHRCTDFNRELSSTTAHCGSVGQMPLWV